MDEDDVTRLLELALARQATEFRDQVAGLLAAMAVPVPTLTVRELLLDHYGRSLEATGMDCWRSEEARIRLHLVRLLGDKAAATLTLADVEAYRRQRATERATGRKTLTSPATRNREVIRLSAALSWASEQGRALLARNPILGCAPEPENNVRRTCRTPDDVARVAEHAPNPIVAAMILCDIGSGLRRGELIRLRLDQIDEVDGLIRLHSTETKSERPRYTILTAEASQAIRALPRPLDSPYVFVAPRTGRPYHARTFLRYYQDACARAGISAAPGERNWVHDLRAGFVTHHVEVLGTDRRTVMDMTGHNSHAVFDRYVRSGRTHIVEAKARADAARKSPKRAVDTRVVRQRVRHNTQ